ncbi:MAG: cytosine permease [Actinomycetota bacterium]
MTTSIDRAGDPRSDAPVSADLVVVTSDRRLSGIDMAVLWGDLSIGILVLYTGALLVPALSLQDALGAIVIGSLLGCIPLAVVAAAGARSGTATMALFRPVLGVRGSYLPSVINAVQLVGWAAFEFWAMAGVANAVTREATGRDLYPVWLVGIALGCTALALVGPVRFVRRWLERFGIYVLLAAGAWLTFRVLTVGDLSAVWGAPGTGGLGFWLGVDLVIAMPVSWLPLVADYTRFSTSSRGAFAGVFGGYLVGNVWFYSLGALLVLLAGSQVGVLGIGDALIALAGGAVVLASLVVGETDAAFANLYSAAVSVGNIAPRLSRRRLIVAIATIAFAIALFLGESAETFELFLLTIGSVFVPLFGVFLAHETMRTFGWQRSESSSGVDAAAVVAWLAGVIAYHWSSPSPLPGWQQAVAWFFEDLLGVGFPLAQGSLGASIPGFVVAFVIGLGGFAATRRTR